MAVSLFSGLRRIAEVFYLRLFGEQINVEHLDADQLKPAYREVAGVKPIVNTLAGFILAGGLKVDVDDEEAADVLDKFLRRNMGVLRRACRESCLYGYTWIMPYWSAAKNAARLRVYSPRAVQLNFSQTDPDEVEQAVITSTRELVTTRQTITATTWKIERNDQVLGSGVNQLGLIPVFPVHLNRFSDDEFGSSVMSDALYQTLREKAVLRSKGLSIERRQSSLLAVSGGRADIIKPKLEAVDSDKPTIPALYLPDPKATVGFVESRRGPEGVIELLKMLYHDAIVDGEVPEYLLGVGMPSAQASTREQRAKIESVVNPLRDDWLEPLELLMTLVLRLHEVHEVRKFSTYDTIVAFGPLFEKDAVAEADTLDKRATAMTKLSAIGAISTETIRENLPEVVPDPAREKERVDSERAEQDPYPNPTEPTDRTNPTNKEPAEETVSAQESAVSAMEGRWVTIEGRHILLGAKGGGGGGSGGGGVGAAVGGDLVAASGETPGGAKYWVQQDTDPTGDDVKSPEAQVEANGKTYRGPASLKDGNVVVHDAGRKIIVTVKPEDAADVKRVFESRDATKVAREQVLTQQVPGLAEVRAASEAHHVATSRYEAARETAQEHEDFRPVTPPSPALAERHAAVREQYPRAALYVKAENQATSGSWADNTGKQAAGRKAMSLIRKGASLEEAKAALAERRPLND